MMVKNKKFWWHIFDGDISTFYGSTGEGRTCMRAIELKRERESWESKVYQEDNWIQQWYGTFIFAYLDMKGKDRIEYYYSCMELWIYIYTMRVTKKGFSHKQ